ncbi:MAG: efflux RND transporter permease subunit, partial [Elusimicrobiota bacterium]
MEASFHRLARVYRRLLTVCLENRWKVVLLSLAFFGLSLSLVKKLRKEFVPPQDQSMFMVRVQTPVGSSMEFTDAKFREIEAWIMSQPVVGRYFSAVGGFGGGEVNTGILFLTLKQKAERPKGPGGKPLTQAQVMAAARKDLNKVPGVRAIVMDKSRIYGRELRSS